MRGRRVRGLGVALLAGLAFGVPGAVAAPPSEDPVALERAGIPSCPPRVVHVDRGETRTIPIRCRGLNDVEASVVKGPRHGERGNVNQGRDRIRYTPDTGYRGPDRLIYERRSGGHLFRAATRIVVGRDAKAPRCRDKHVVARSESAVRIRIRCRGEGLRDLKVNTGGAEGEVSNVHESASAGSGGATTRTITARYTPPPGFSGQESLTIGATSAPGCSEVSIWCGGGRASFGSVDVSVLPWRMRALGDSVTAGFGYYGDAKHNGVEMTVGELPECRPPAVVNNRCSSNSSERGGYTGPPGWSPDYGLANNVSWAAQFANGLQGGGKVTAPDMFQNLAVTGSAPADWLPNGELDDELEAIVAENPELVAMTLGANPLLSDFLLTVDGEECADTDDVAQLEACIQPYIDRNQVAQRLQAIYETLLGAPDSTVVAFQYHLAIPAANLFETWQLEVMGDKLNEQIELAVQATKAALPGDADRLIMIPAQVEPGPTPAGTLPRFDIGLPPDGQGWTPVYDCGDGDLVDGPSHQSLPTQDEFQAEHPFEYCEGDEWIIGSDSGIHPNREGYAQFAAALSAVAEQRNLVPRLP